MRFIKKKKVVNEDFHPDTFSKIFSSCFFIGYISKASGTFASLFGILFFLIPGFQNLNILLPAIVICFAAGVYTSGNMMKRFGDDPSEVVIDEVVGMWITVMIFLLFNADIMALNFLQFSVLFFSFRFFDIVKIQPAKYFDKLDSAFGVMMDDVIAGIYAGVAAVFFLKLFNNF
ncbi:MAG TPA: phosphatidylglycerophosphatase A [Ignavibacteria bacterium]|nr:phosphatidylglycerophosphatase A [Ignavibacteria bacterium]